MNVLVGLMEQARNDRSYIAGAFFDPRDPRHCEGMEVAYFTIDSSRGVGDRHFHEEMWELTVVLSGTLYEEVDGKLLELGPGCDQNFYLAPPGTVCQTRGAEDGTIILVVKAPAVSGDKVIVDESNKAVQHS